MALEKNVNSVMIISSNPKATDFFTNLIPKSEFSPIISVTNAGEARRLLSGISIDIAIIITPLTDEFGTELALELSRRGESGVLLVCKPELFESVTDKVENEGVYTLAGPMERQVAFQSLKLIVATRSRLKKLQSRTSADILQSKMEEIRIVNRAKLLLIEKLKMSEQEAHRYIEKSAMDQCIKRRLVAENIISTYGN